MNVQANSEEAMETFKEMLRNPEMIKNNIQKLVEEEKELFGESVSQLQDLALYFKKNWKVIVPALAIFGLSTFVINGQLEVSSSRTRTRKNRRNEEMDF